MEECMFSRPGRIRKLESRMALEEPCVIDEVGKNGLLSIQPTTAGSFLLEREDVFFEVKPLTWVVELEKKSFEEKV